MNYILADSNVLIDIIKNDATWYKWSAQTLEQLANDNYICINPIIYAEISLNFNKVEELDFWLKEADIKRLDLPWHAGFLAGRAYQQYKKSGGTKASTLPDFYIGAHATTQQIPLLTRNAKDYKQYFPKLKLITP